MDSVNTINRRTLLENDTLHILPTFLRVEEEMMSDLNESECGVIFGKRVFTFPQLIERIYEEIPNKESLLSYLGQRVLIEKVVESLYKGKKEGYFTLLVGSRTFSITLRNMLNELKSFNILCDEYEGIVEQWKGQEREKLIELARIYRCYHTSLIDHELIDQNDMSVMVKDFVTDLDNEIVFLKGIRRLIVEDMYDFTPVQLDLIIALAHRVGHTDVSIPYDHNKGDIFSYVERTIRKFESLWDLSIDINLDFKPQGDTNRGKLSEITKNYLKPNDPLAGNETVLIEDEVILIEAAGIYQEAEAIGKEIRKLLDAGVEPNKIGVLFSNLAVYSEMIEDVFNRFKIPIYFRRGKPLLSSNVIKTVVSFFELLGKNFERNAFLKIARSNYIDFWGGDESLSGEKIESYILRAGIIDDRGNSWENRLGRLIEKIEKTKSSAKKNTSANVHEEREEAKLLKDRVKYVKGEIELLKKENTIIGFIAILRGLMRSLKMHRKIMECEDGEILKRDIAAVKKLDEIFEEMKATVTQLGLEEESVTYNYFRSMLLKFMEEKFILSGRESVHGVKVLNLYESRGITFEYVFLGGLMEDSFPAKSWQDPFFKDEEKAQFNHRVGKKVFLLMEEKLEEEPLLFYLGLSRAKERLYLSYSRVDAKGRTVLPSLYLNEVMRLVEKKDGFNSLVTRELIVPQLEDCFEQEELENRLSYIIWSPSLNDEGEASNSGMREKDLTALLFNQLIGHDQFTQNFNDIFQCAEIEKSREQFFLDENIISRRSKANKWTGLITHEVIREKLKKYFEEEEPFWSPSYLELYARCPFRFFLQRVLKIVPLKLPEEEIEKVDEGSLIHRVLERFFRVRKEKGLLPINGSEDEKEQIKRVAEEVCQQWEREEYIGNRELWEIKKRKLSPLWERFIEEESLYTQEGFLPTYFEFRIGSYLGGKDKPDMPELVFKDFDQKEIMVGGKVDRIDVGSDTVRVIDYKNSSGEQFYRELLKEENMGVVNFQLPVYLEAVKDYMCEHNKNIKLLEGTFYLFRKAKRMKPYVVESSDSYFEKDIGKRIKIREQGKVNLFNQMSENVRRAKSGDYSVCPQECAFCEYSHMCRFVVVAIDEGEG